TAHLPGIGPRGRVWRRTQTPCKAVARLHHGPRGDFAGGYTLQTILGGFLRRFAWSEFGEGLAGGRRVFAAHGFVFEGGGLHGSAADVLSQAGVGGGEEVVVLDLVHVGLGTGLLVALLLGAGEEVAAEDLGGGRRAGHDLGQAEHGQL